MEPENRLLPVVTQQRGELQALRVSTRSLLRTIESLTDEQAREPSRLPGWNRAMVLTHIARNADGVRNMVEHATRNEYGDMYPGGIDQRRNDIDAGAEARAADLLYDVRHSADLLIEAWETLPADAGDRRGRTLSAERTMDEMLFVRLREVELHHVDLALGYEVSDWPVGFVSASLDQIFSTFDQRGSSTRPRLDTDFRIVSTDHDEAWRVQLRGGQVRVAPDDGSPADGEARGWGCDIAAWLYGRDPRGGGVTASGDLTVLRLPTWFPYA
jgi:maleylpyruvate isomerase